MRNAKCVVRNEGSGAQNLEAPQSLYNGGIRALYKLCAPIHHYALRIFTCKPYECKIKKSSIPKGTKDSWYHPILLIHCWINLYLYAGIDLDTSALYRAHPGCFMIQPSWLKVHLPQRHPYSFSPTGALFTGFLCVLFLSLPICNCM